MWNGSSWDRIPSSNLVTNVFGRTGSITAQSGDYTWDQINKTTSSIGDIADVDLSSAPANNNVLIYNGTKWVPGSIDTTPAAATITNSMLAGSIDQSKVSGLSTSLSLLQEKTSLATDVRNVALTGLSSASTAIISATDTILTGFGKLQGQLNDILNKQLTGLSITNSAISGSDTILTGFGKLQGQLIDQSSTLSTINTDYVSKSNNSTISGELIFNSIGTISINYSPTNLTDATSKSYVDAAISGRDNWVKSGSDGYTTGKVSIGSSTIGSENLTVTGNIQTTGQVYTGVFSDTIGSLNFAQGNSAYSSWNCGSNYTLSNVKEGGTYTFVNTNTGTTPCGFNTTIDGTSVTYRFMPAND